MANRTLTTNRDIRELMESHNIRLWQLADFMGTQETALCRKLRHELTETEKDDIRETINMIIEGGAV